MDERPGTVASGDRQRRMLVSPPLPMIGYGATRSVTVAFGTNALETRQQKVETLVHLDSFLLNFFAKETSRCSGKGTAVKL